MKKSLLGSFILLIVAFWVGLPALVPYPSGDLRMGDFIDQGAIVHGLEATKTFEKTLTWWTGPWVAAHVNAFYRPLTSTVWWFEYQIFGPDGAAGFMLLHWTYHLALCFLAFAFFRRVLGHRIAVIAVAIWAASLANYLSLPTPAAALSEWKDDPDIWISGAVILSLWSLLSYWRTSRGIFLSGAIVFQLIGIAFKEMAYVTPFLAALLLWFEWKSAPFIIERRHWLPVATLFGIVALAYLFRFWALQGPGFRFGSNGSWFQRWLMYVFAGRPINLLMTGQWGASVFALLCLGIGMVCIQRRRVGLPLILSGIGLALAADWRVGQPFATALLLLAYSPAIPFWRMLVVTDTLLTLVIMGLWIGFFLRRDPKQIFGFGWMLLAYLPLMTAPITEHALYLPSMGWGIFLAISAEAVWEQIRSWRDFKLPRPNSASTDTGAKSGA